MAKDGISKDVKVEMVEKNGETTAYVKIVTVENGEENIVNKTFTGTREEVDAQVKALKESADN